MEQTLGKRIAENRKRLGLTQDSLAEQLGITAQAVSKWENDQSCPDITILPTLAEIFGITIDELLGREVPRPVHQAEVVDEEPEDNGIHIQNGNWQFHWDNGRKDAVTFAILVLWVGALILAAKQFGWDDSFWGILWPSVLLIYGGRGLLGGFSVFHVGMTLCGAYYLIDNLEICEISLAGEYILHVIIIILGICLLIDALKTPRKPRFIISHNGKDAASDSEKTRCECTTTDDRFDCSLSFGENTHYVNVSALAGGEASVSFGQLNIDLTGCQTLQEGCSIDANCSFGELVLLVPRRFRVEKNSSTAFATVETEGHPDPAPAAILYLNANVSFGEINIKYV